MRVSPSGQWLVLHFHQEGVPLGSLRRLVRPADAPRLVRIRSLAYLRPVIDELQENPAPDNYREYLRLKLRHAAKALPGNAQKNYVF
jgi:hypothetical protein